MTQEQPFIFYGVLRITPQVRVYVDGVVMNYYGRYQQECDKQRQVN